MNELNNLKLSDIISPTITPEEYLELFGDKIKKTYDVYKPKKEIIVKIKNILEGKKEKLHIVALGAEWCPDCSKNVTIMIKIIKESNDADIDLNILYGIMVNAQHKPGDTIWHKKRSPPEATDPKFELKKIPTFYFFNDTGEYIGSIVEKPKSNSTLEEDILEILEGKM